MGFFEYVFTHLPLMIGLVILTIVLKLIFGDVGLGIGVVIIFLVTAGGANIAGRKGD